ncbi:hypothetical protein EF847_03095 [Actinobacteria bacterium YIM 96077]|nr:hypothetical protein EF847_03095 [Actinobacteria bacterium YIM 96077]
MVDIHTVAELCTRSGPFLSVYLDVSRNETDADHQLDVRWRSAREQLHARGAPSDLLDAVGHRVLSAPAHGGNVARMIVAAEDDILVDDIVRRPRSDEVLTWGQLPDVTSWLTDRAMMRPVLVVLADREGADLELHETWPDRVDEQETVEGGTEHINKVQVGGWSHKRYLRRSELRWRRNAEHVAPEIEKRVAAGVRLIVITGDVRAQKEIHDALSESTRELLVEIQAGGRHPGDSRESLDDAIDEAVQDVVLTDHLRIIRELEEEAGRAGAAAIGLDDVAAALIRGQVGTLLLAPTRAASRQLAPGDYPGLPLPGSARDEDELRADLAVLCAAAMTGADAVMAPRSLSADGVAALLRWNESTA